MPKPEHFYARPKVVFEGTLQGDFLRNICEGACMSFADFVEPADDYDWEPYSPAQTKQTLSNLKRKGLIEYDRSARVWCATEAGMRLHDEELS